MWQLEAGGPAVLDTTVSFASRSGRTIVLRHSPPDDAIFLVFTVPPSTDSAPSPNTTIAIQPVPGHYAFTLTTTSRLPVGTTATFSYAIHFRTPAAAVARYPSPGRFEQLLFAAQLTADNHVQFLNGDRPAADMLRFTVSSPGTYALVAPR